MKKVSAVLGILATLALTAAPAFAATGGVAPETLTQTQVFNAPILSGDSFASDFLFDFGNPDIANNGYLTIWYPGQNLPGIDGINITGGPLPSDPNVLSADIKNSIADIKNSATASASAIPAGTYHYQMVLAPIYTNTDACMVNIGATSFAQIQTDCSAYIMRYQIYYGTFTVTADAPGSAPVITGIGVSTSTAGSMLAAAEATVKDPGVLEILALVAGVYITFYVLRALIQLPPGGKN